MIITKFIETKIETSILEFKLVHRGKLKLYLWTQLVYLALANIKFGSFNI